MSHVRVNLAMSWYLHIDMDAFFASVEQALDPTLNGKPVIVGGQNGRGVVTSASYEARRFGVHSAMPGFQAKKLCPQGIFLPNRHGLYREFSRKVFAILEQYSPQVHALSIDEGVVDLSGTEKLFGFPLQSSDQIIRRLKAELGLPASGGLSTHRVLAKIAATLAKPGGLLYVPERSEKDFLRPLAVKLIPGIGPKTDHRMRQRGIKTIADLLEYPELTAHYLHLEKADARTGTHEHSIGSETTLDEPLKEREQMERVLWNLVENVGSRLRREEIYTGCLTLKIRYANFTTVTRSRTLSAPSCFDREIFAVVSELLRQHLLKGSAVRLLGVTAGALQSSGWQELLLSGRQRKSWEKLYRGIDQLRQKYGADAIGSAAARNRSG